MSHAFSANPSDLAGWLCAAPDRLALTANILPDIKFYFSLPATAGPQKYPLLGASVNLTGYWIVCVETFLSAFLWRMFAAAACWQGGSYDRIVLSVYSEKLPI